VDIYDRISFASPAFNAVESSCGCGNEQLELL
jgi:hypothetical protein